MLKCRQAKWLRYCKHFIVIKFLYKEHDLGFKELCVLIKENVAVQSLECNSKETFSPLLSVSLTALCHDVPALRGSAFVTNEL